MNPQVIRILPKRDDAPAVVPGLLVHLGELDEDYMIDDPAPDFREWPVTLPDKRRVGRVDDLIIDSSTMTVKYLEVHVARDAHLGNVERWILVPVDAVRIDTDEGRVVLERLPSAGLNGAPRQRGLVPTTKEQHVIDAYFELQSAGAGQR